MKGSSRLDHLKTRDWFLIIPSFLALIYIIGSICFFDPDFGMIQCVISNCTENSIQLGGEEVNLAFKCLIEKSNCSTDCYLKTKYLNIIE